LCLQKYIFYRNSKNSRKLKQWYGYDLDKYVYWRFFSFTSDLINRSTGIQAGVGFTLNIVHKQFVH